MLCSQANTPILLRKQLFPARKYIVDNYPCVSVSRGWCIFRVSIGPNTRHRAKAKTVITTFSSNEIATYARKNYIILYSLKRASFLTRQYAITPSLFRSEDSSLGTFLGTKKERKKERKKVTFFFV
jgi:hypothetical protein